MKMFFVQLFVSHIHIYIIYIHFTYNALEGFKIRFVQLFFLWNEYFGMSTYDLTKHNFIRHWREYEKKIIYACSTHVFHHQIAFVFLSKSSFNALWQHLHHTSSEMGTRNLIFGYPESAEKWVKCKLNTDFLANFWHIWWYFKVPHHLQFAPFL